MKPKLRESNPFVVMCLEDSRLRLQSRILRLQKILQIFHHVIQKNMTQRYLGNS